jgi:hypothetical protein
MGRFEPMFTTKEEPVQLTDQPVMKLVKFTRHHLPKDDYLFAECIFGSSKTATPFPLTILNFIQFVESRDHGKFKAEYLQTKGQDRHYLLKTDKFYRSFERLDGLDQFLAYFPEAVVLESPSMHQFAVGLKIYDPKTMDSWFLRLFVDGEWILIDLLVRDKSVQTGIDILTTLALLLTKDH